MTTAALGAPPSGWRMGRIKDLVGSTVNGTWGDEPLGDGQDVNCVRAADFDRRALTVRVDKLPLRRVDPVALRRHQLRPGDLVWEKSGGGETQPVGLAVMFDLNQAAVCSNFCTRIRPSTGINPRYLAYVFAAAYAVGLNQRSIKQTTGLQNLDGGSFLAEPWPIPPLAEQRRIADFLDVQSTRIDKLAQAKGAQAKLVVERYEAILASRTSELFDQYGAIPVRRIWRGIEQGWSPQCDDVEADPESWAVLRTSAVSTGTFNPMAHKRLPVGVEPDLRYAIKDGDLLMTRGSGSPSLVGVAAIAQTGGRKLLLSDLLYRVGLLSGWSSLFVALMLQSLPVRDQVSLLLRGQSGQTIKLRGQDVGEISVPRAPRDSQHLLAQEIADMRTDHMETAQKMSKSVLLLAERLKALITAAVTGQIDVTTARGVDV